MIKKTHPDDFRYYEIRVEGHLNDIRRDEFGDMSVTSLPDGQTQISGQIVDQAQLFGILIRIRDMGIPLLSVNTKQYKVRPPKGTSK